MNTDVLCLLRLLMPCKPEAPFHYYGCLNIEHEKWRLSRVIVLIQDWQINLVFSLLEILAETITEVGDPKVVICEAVDKLNVELLVLGSHGRGAIERYILSRYPGAFFIRSWKADEICHFAWLSIFCFFFIRFTLVSW